MFTHTHTHVLSHLLTRALTHLRCVHTHNVLTHIYSTYPRTQMPVYTHAHQGRWDKLCPRVVKLTFHWYSVLSHTHAPRTCLYTHNALTHAHTYLCTHTHISRTHMHALIHTFTRVCIHMYSHTLNHVHIQSKHVELYFTVEEQQERRTKFEWENKISWFVFVTPFTPDGKQHGDVTRHCMRKTILTST